MKTKIKNIAITRIAQRTFAFVRNVGPYQGDAALFERLFGIVGTWAGAKGLLTSPKTESLSLYHDDPFNVPAAEQRISVGFTVPEETSPEGEIQIMEIPEGRYVVGSFEILPNEYGDAWTEVMSFVEDEGLLPQVNEFMYESYKNDPHTHPEGKHLVDICVGLKN